MLLLLLILVLPLCISVFLVFMQFALNHPRKAWTALGYPSCYYSVRLLLFNFFMIVTFWALGLLSKPLLISTSLFSVCILIFLAFRQLACIYPYTVWPFLAYYFFTLLLFEFFITVLCWFFVLSFHTLAFSGLMGSVLYIFFTLFLFLSTRSKRIKLCYDLTSNILPTFTFFQTESLLLCGLLVHPTLVAFYLASYFF